MARPWRTFVDTVRFVVGSIADTPPPPPRHDCSRDGCYAPAVEPERLHRVVAAVRDIEDVAVGGGALQMGAAYALGTLSLAVEAGPGWSAEDVARALVEGVRPDAAR